MNLAGEGAGDVARGALVRDRARRQSDVGAAGADWQAEVLFLAELRVAALAVFRAQSFRELFPIWLHSLADRQDAPACNLMSAAEHRGFVDFGGHGGVPFRQAGVFAGKDTTDPWCASYARPNSI